MAAYADLTERSRANVDKLVLHCLSLPFPEEREPFLKQVEGAVAEMYAVGDGMALETATRMARQWVGVVRERLAAAEAHGRMRRSDERPNA